MEEMGIKQTANQYRMAEDKSVMEEMHGGCEEKHTEKPSGLGGTCIENYAATVQLKRLG